MHGKDPIFSIVILTYNRIDVLVELLEELRNFHRSDIEVLIVDNASVDGTLEKIKQDFPFFRVISQEKNLGAVGRNKGMEKAKGKYVVTIDDDILGMDFSSLRTIQAIFENEPTIGAICFKVLDYYTGQVCNLCHPVNLESAANCFFETSEISEGAVAFRNEMFTKTGYYTEEFFISHEGADLVARILSEGYKVFYTPQVTVRHKYAKEARASWRRYYYDTRNDFWLAVRNYRFWQAICHLVTRLPKTFIYSCRDGYLRYWVKAVKDALGDLPKMLKQRHPVSLEVQRKIKALNKNKPGFFYYFRKRFFAKNIRI